MTHAALHPRLRQPMTVTDHAHFVAEHDDYHMARITELLGEFGAGRRAAPGAPTTKGAGMAITRISPGPRFSGAVVHGDTVYVAGQTAADRSADARTQTEQVLQKIDGLLQAAGTDKSRLLSATVYLSDIRYFDEMNAAWDAWVDKEHLPTRATVEARLAAPQLLVEIVVTAALP